MKFMEIHGTGRAEQAREITQRTPPRAPAVAGVDQANLSNTAALQGALQKSPATRPDAVARAKELLADPSYPSAAVIDQTADLLAKNLS